MDDEAVVPFCGGHTEVDDEDDVDDCAAPLAVLLEGRLEVESKCARSLIKGLLVLTIGNQVELGVLAQQFIPQQNSHWPLKYPQGIISGVVLSNT